MNNVIFMRLSYKENTVSVSNILLCNITRFIAKEIKNDHILAENEYSNKFWKKMQQSKITSKYEVRKYPMTLLKWNGTNMELRIL